MKAPATRGFVEPRTLAKSLANCSWTFIVPTLIFMPTETKDLHGLQMHERDTGSADVQIALLTQRINHLTEHLKTNAKDHSSRRGLLMMVAKRRKLLDYLKKNSGDRYQNVLEKLSLRK